MRVAAASPPSLALVAAAPAAAHVGVKSYSPKRGATVARSLERVKVTFKGRVTDGKLTVRDADGDKVSIGEGKVVERQARGARPPEGRPRRRAPTRPR